MQNVHGQTSSGGPRTGAGGAPGPQGRSLPRASGEILSAGRNRNFRPPARGEAGVGRAEALAHSTRRVHISLRDPSPPRPRTSSRDHAPPESAGLGAGGLAGALPAAGMLEQIQP